MNQQSNFEIKENYLENRGFSDKFVTSVKRIIGECFLREAPLYEDLKENTDIRKIELWPHRYGFRVRRPKEIRFKEDFTFFYESPHGPHIPVEFEKVIKGNGDYFLYGFSNEEETDLAAWAICDLRIFRGYIAQYLLENKGNLPAEIKEKYNKTDGTYLGKFIIFKWEQIPKSAIYAHKNLFVTPQT